MTTPCWMLLLMSPAITNLDLTITCIDVDRPNEKQKTCTIIPTFHSAFRFTFSVSHFVFVHLIGLTPPLHLFRNHLSLQRFATNMFSFFISISFLALSSVASSSTSTCFSSHAGTVSIIVRSFLLTMTIVSIVSVLEGDPAEPITFSTVFFCVLCIISARSLTHHAASEFFWIFRSTDSDWHERII